MRRESVRWPGHVAASLSPDPRQASPAERLRRQVARLESIRGRPDQPARPESLPSPSCRVSGRCLARLAHQWPGSGRETAAPARDQHVEVARCRNRPVRSAPRSKPFPRAPAATLRAVPMLEVRLKGRRHRGSVVMPSCARALRAQAHRVRAFGLRSTLRAHQPAGRHRWHRVNARDIAQSAERAPSPRVWPSRQDSGCPPRRRLSRPGSCPAPLQDSARHPVRMRSARMRSGTGMNLYVGSSRSVGSGRERARRASHANGARRRPSTVLRAWRA